eukprot:scaffold21636_cov60-Phaeocystis_antarctica.AAC.2
MCIGAASAAAGSMKHGATRTPARRRTVAQSERKKGGRGWTCARRGWVGGWGGSSVRKWRTLS